MKKVILPISFFIITPIFILACIFYLTYISFKTPSSETLSFTPKSAVAYAALPTLDTQISAEIVQADSRVEIVRQFFQRYRSPLEPFAKEVVDAADKYGIDFRLVPAIGMQESNNCIHPPAGTNNCWGYGIYKGSRKAFADYGAGIEAVSKGLASYKQDGLETPEQIMSRYTPSSTGSWAFGVNHFIAQLQ